MPINDLKKGEGVKLDVVDAIVDGGPPGLALTISKLSSCLLSPSERGLLALLLEVTFMASFPACSMFICADTSLLPGSKSITLLIEYSGHGMYLHRY